MENNNRNQGSDKKNNRTGVIICLIVALGLFLVFSIMNNQVKNATNKEITYDQFLQLLEDGNVNAELSARNIADVKTARTNTINVYDILKYNTATATKAAVANIEEVYA